jgi:NAD(P)-dependent dehydrogenase (short-subunit alcohol dehydrogenase family)
MPETTTRPDGQDAPLSGQTALVTGASRGLGRAIARRLAREGAAVCCNYLSRSAEAEALVNEIRAAGGHAIAVGADIGDPDQVRAMIERSVRELGPVSVLVNNAGLLLRGTLDSFDPAALERMRRTNVDGLIHVTRAAAPGMKEGGYGRIVNLSSIAGHGTSLPGNAFYAATKAAVSVLTRRFAMELGPYGITVNAVAPGFIPTEMAKVGRTEEQYRDIVKQISDRSMVGRPGKPEEIAHAVAFLAAPESGFITAQVLTVDGGRMDYISHP